MVGAADADDGIGQPEDGGDGDEEHGVGASHDGERPDGGGRRDEGVVALPEVERDGGEEQDGEERRLEAGGGPERPRAG